MPAAAIAAEPPNSACRPADDFLELTSIAAYSTFERHSREALAAGAFKPTLFWWVWHEGDDPDEDEVLEKHLAGFVELDATSVDAHAKAATALAKMPRVTLYVLVWPDGTSLPEYGEHSLMLEFGARHLRAGYRIVWGLSNTNVAAELGCAGSLFSVKRGK